MDKIKLKESSFLDWYFSEPNDLYEFARGMISELQVSGTITITTQNILDRCGYIPAYICDIIDEDKEGEEYDPSEIKLMTKD